MKKRRVIVLLTVATIVLIAFVLVVVSPFGSSTDWPTFEKRLPMEIEAAGFRMLERRNYSPHLVSQPFISRLRSAYLRRIGEPPFNLGLPEFAAVLLVERDGHPPIECIIRHNEAQVIRIVIRHPAAAKQDARALTDALKSALPNETVRMEQVGPISN
jgi:hypothetical protein